MGEEVFREHAARPALPHLPVPNPDFFPLLLLPRRFPSLVRFSWSTSVTIVDKNCAKVDWECEDEGGADQQSLAAAMAGGAGKTSLKSRHSYFRARKLQRVHSGW